MIEPTSSRAGIYVGLTRGRTYNTAWILDPTGQADPEDALAAAIAGPANATTALATRERLHRARGIEPPVSQAPTIEPDGGRVSEPPTDTTGPGTPGDKAVERMRRRLDALQQRRSPARELSL